MSGPKRNPDKLNTIGVVVVGICGAVLVYVTIVALQAFYMNDTSEIQTMADYGGQETKAKDLKSEQIGNITQSGTNQGTATFHIPIDQAIKLVIEDAKKDPAHLIPAMPPSTHPTIEPIFGHPKTGAPAPAGAGSAAAPAEGAGSAAAQVPTGAGGGEAQPVAGAGAQPTAKASTEKADAKTEKAAPKAEKAAPKTEKTEKAAPKTEKTEKAAPKTEKKAAPAKGAGSAAGGGNGH